MDLIDAINAVLFACAALISTISLLAAIAVGLSLAKINEVAGSPGMRHWSLSLGGILAVLSCLLAFCNLIAELRQNPFAPFFNLFGLILMGAALIARREFQSSWDRWLETETSEARNKRASGPWPGVAFFLAEVSFLISEVRRFVVSTILTNRTAVRVSTLSSLSVLIAVSGVAIMVAALRQFTDDGLLERALNLIAALSAPVFLIAISRRLANLDFIMRLRKIRPDDQQGLEFAYLVPIRGAATAGDSLLWLLITITALVEILGLLFNGFASPVASFNVVFAACVLVLNGSVFWFELRRGLSRLAEVALTSGFNAGRDEPAFFIDQAAHKLNNLLMPVRFVINELNKSYEKGPDAVVNPELYELYKKRLRGARDTLRLLDDWREDLKLRARRLAGQAQPSQWIAIDSVIEPLVQGARVAVEQRKRASKIKIAFTIGYVDKQNERKWSESFKADDADDPWALQPIPLDIRVDRSAFHDVLANLISNAFEAVERRFSEPGAQDPEGGPHIEITVDRVLPHTPFAISIRDNGGGVSDSIVTRLFMPYVTTNIERAGGGLGLFMSKRTIASLGGTLSYVTKPGQGTTFFVRLPESLVRAQGS